MLSFLSSSFLKESCQGEQKMVWDFLFLNDARHALPIRKEQCIQKFSSETCKYVAEPWPTDFMLENLWTCLDLISPSISFT